MSEVIEERGGYRARIVHDHFPSEPHNDGGCPVIRIDSNGYGTARYEHTGYGAYYDPGFDAEAALAHFDERWGTREGLEIFERYVRIFHEGTVEWRLGTSREYGYVTFTTRKLAQEWGNPDDKPVPAAEMQEWEAYVEGDVYGVVIEEQTVTITEVLDREGRQLSKTEEDSWTEVDSCFGFYGYEWAVESAKDNLNYYAPKENAA